MQQRGDQFHKLRLVEWLDPFNEAAGSFLDRAAGPSLHQTGNAVAAKLLALQSLANLRWPQASALPISMISGCWPLSRCYSCSLCC
jgi:DHA2 family multidrug resistance protein